MRQTMVMKLWYRNKVPLQYSTGGGDLYLQEYQMSENIWTERLKDCLRHFLPAGFTVDLTVDDGRVFPRTQNGYTTDCQLTCTIAIPFMEAQT